MSEKKKFEEVIDQINNLTEKETSLISFDTLKKIIIEAVHEFKGKEMYQLHLVMTYLRIRIIVNF